MNKELKLSDRNWVCKSCGTIHKIGAGNPPFFRRWEECDPLIALVFYKVKLNLAISNI